MKTKFYMSAALLCALALTTGCSEEEYANGQQQVKSDVFSLKASAGSDTRTSVDGSLNVTWSEGDAIFVYGGNNTSATLTLDANDAGKATGNFSGTLTGEEDLQYAVYPAGSFKISQAKPTTFTFPNEYKSSVWKTKKEGETYTYMVSSSPMYGTVSTTGTGDAAETKATFTHHLAALMRITLKDVPQNTSATLTLTGTNIAGDATFSNTGTTPSLTMGNSSTDGNTITVDFGGQTGNLVFDIPLPPTSSEVQISAKMTINGTESPTVFTTEKMTITAGDVIKMPAISKITVEATTVNFTTETNNQQEAQAAIDNGAKTVATSVDVSSGNSDATLQLVSTENNATSTLILNSLSTGENTLKIEAKSDETVSQPVTVKLDNSSSADGNQANVEINLPQSTVTLAPVGETTTFDKVTATTAANTLIVEAGVTIEELIIKGGNVDVRGTVKKLSRDASNSSIVTVTSSGAADIQTVTDNDSKFKFTSTWDGTSKVAATNNMIYTAAQLANLQSKTAPTSSNKDKLTATVSSGTELMADIDLNDQPWLGMVLSTAIFNGNSHTIKNLNMSTYILNQTETQYTPQACIGLFAAVYGNSTIKDLTLSKVTIRPDATASPKWVGSLVGYSKGTTVAYTNCKAENVDIYVHGNNSYRVGGLIGYIEKAGTSSTTALTTLAGCQVNTASIAATFSYGGLVGSMYDSAKFDQCSVSNITLSLNDQTAGLYYGYVSPFIGDIKNSKTNGYDRTITITKCTSQELTDTDKANLKITTDVDANKGFDDKYKWCGIVEPLVSGETGTFTIVVDNNTWTQGQEATAE